MKKNKQTLTKTLIIMMSFIMPSQSFLAQVSSYANWNTEELNTAEHADYLSEIEKEIIIEINMVRTNPGKYAQDFVKPLLEFYQGLYFRYPGQVPMVTAEGKSALLDCIDALEETTATDILYPSKGLSKASEELLSDQSVSGNLGHTGKDGSNPFERMSKYGKWVSSAAENIDYGNNTARWVVLSLLIDDGVPGRGHRKNLLSPSMGKIGLAFGTHPSYGNMCVMDLASDYIEK